MSPTGHKHLVDALIEERAPTLFRTALTRSLMRHALFPCLGYADAVAAVDTVRDMGGAEVMAHAMSSLGLGVGTIGSYRMPAHGRVIVAPNHPTGLADGVAVWGALNRVRQDIHILANRDALRLSRGLGDVVIPVEWAKTRPNPADSRRVLADVAAALRGECAVVLFPSGRIAYMTWRGLKERPWLATVVTLARKFQAPILPVHIRARNSWLFYGLSQLANELRDVTLFQELLNKRNRRFELTFGDLIDAADLPSDPNTATRMLQHHVEHELPRASRRRPRIVPARPKLAQMRLPSG